MKEIKDYPGYFISENGVINSFRKNNKSKILISCINKGGYVAVYLYKEKKKNTLLLHRLVAQAFIPNPENKLTVNHIDGNKLNNHVSNLEWASRSENCQHAWDNGLNRRTEKCTKAVSESVSVKVICRITGRIYPNIRNAALVFGCSESYMAMMLRGKRNNKTTFKYL